MPRQFKVSTVLVFILTALFILFFDRSKHVPSLADVNSFNIDPYDGVGSFAVLLASFTGLLSLVRAFRAYPTDENGSNQTLLILRGETVTVLSIAITLAADTVAMFRNPSIAFGSSAGWTLTLLVIGLALLTTLASWRIYRSTKHISLAAGNRSWKQAVIICLVSIIILAVYPPSWDDGILGGILTALLGMLILFIPLWALATAISPVDNFHYEDFIDDLISIYHWLETHSGLAAGSFNLFKRFIKLSWIKTILSWLNPRRHQWNFIILIAVAAGTALASAEAIGEGASPDLSRFVLVMSVFTGIGGTGVLIGYTLLAKYLGIYRT